MTRLIDADKLLKHKSDHETISTHLIWNAPTVDAIPISWIKEWVEEIKDHPAYTGKEKTLCIEEFEDMLGAWAERKEE